MLLLNVKVQETRKIIIQDTLLSSFSNEKKNIFTFRKKMLNTAPTKEVQMCNHQQKFKLEIFRENVENHFVMTDIINDNEKVKIALLLFWIEEEVC